MDPPGARDERGLQQERLRREEAYYHFINSLSEEEYRLMRDSNLLGTPGEVTAEELRQRLDGAKEQLSVQPRSQNSDAAMEDGSSGTAGSAAEASNGDSLLEWLNTFRRTGNATRSGQSGNQTWRAVSRTNPNSGEFRFSLEININHEQSEPADSSDPAQPLPGPTRSVHNAATRHAPNPLSRPAQGRRPQARRSRGSPAPSLAMAEPSGPSEPAAGPAALAPPPLAASDQGNPDGWSHGQRHSPNSAGAPEPSSSTERPQASPLQEALMTRESHNGRTRARGRGRRARTGSMGAGHRRASQRSRSPLRPDRDAALPSASSLGVDDPPTQEPADPVPEDPESQAPAAGASASARRHPTIMLDLQVRRIRPGESRDRDSVASRTRSRLRMAENTVTFESDSGGFRRTISRSERAGVRTYVSTIRIPLRRISESGLGEPSSAALRSILRQIMTGFGELSSLMETEADAEVGVPSAQAFRGHDNSGPGPREVGEGRGAEGVGPAGAEEEERQRSGGAPGEGRAGSRDTSNLVENGTLPILRLAHFFLLNDEEDEEHPRGLTKEQIDNLSTRTYGQAGAEADAGRACSVCISEYAQGNKLRRLPCAHEFHIHCIDRWLSENNTCPICRQPVLHARQA